MKNTTKMLESEDNDTVLKDLGVAKMLRCRIRYFTDGAVIGSKEFVDEAFANARGNDSAQSGKTAQGCSKAVVRRQAGSCGV